MLLPVEALDELGGWREDFFVDAVDIDLVYHAISEGYKPYIVSGCILRQRFGQPSYTPFLWKWRIGCSNYGPARLYGIYRNQLIVIRRYACTKALRWQWLRSLPRKVPRILLGERQKWAKLRAMAKGIWDGLRYKV